MTRSAFSRKHSEFRKLLIDARKAAGLTQLALAEKIGRPQSFVSKFERGERRLDVIEFIDIARALSLDPEAVIGKLDVPPIGASDPPRNAALRRRRVGGNRRTD